MSLFKLPLIASSAVLFWISYTPPSAAPPPAKSDKPKLGGMEMSFGRFIPILAKICKGVLGYLIEAAVIVAHHIPQSSFSRVISSLCAPCASLGGGRASPAFLASAALVAGGGLLRLACYRSLGSMFTFQLLLRDNHRLVTDGPYAHVRHPSYAALWIVVAGATLMLFGPGSAFWEQGWMDTSTGRMVFTIWLVQRVAECVHLIPRITYEDRFLMERFGEE